MQLNRVFVIFSILLASSSFLFSTWGGPSRDDCDNELGESSRDRERILENVRERTNGRADFVFISHGSVIVVLLNRDEGGGVRPQILQADSLGAEEGPDFFAYEVTIQDLEVVRGRGATGWRINGSLLSGSVPLQISIMPNGKRDASNRRIYELEYSIVSGRPDDDPVQYEPCPIGVLENL